jgi:hypothetical protein
MYGRRGVLYLLLYCTCISPFSSPFLFYFWVRLVFLNFMAVCVFFVYMFVSVWLRCGVVWCGVAPLSLSFSLDRRGDGGSVATQQSGGRGTRAILQLPTC